MFKHYHSQLPSLFDSYMTRARDIHSYNTRRAIYNYQIPVIRTEYRKTSIAFRGPSIWNCIMEGGVNPHVKLVTFKYHLKEILLKGEI